ncbi:MAG: hypothetical protein K2P58_07820 [Hyphomonadaceae bacterium]|nr:hypothetical protein [Hyphomonadaceae bacterium]
MHDDDAPSTPRSDGTPHQADATAPVRVAPLVLWRVAQAFLATLYALFGGPEDVAAQHTFTAKTHAHLASWLRCAEAMLRRLLLIEAAAYPKPNTRPLLRKPRQRVRRQLSFWPDKPDAWRVSFRCFVSSPACEGSVSARSAVTMGGHAAPPSGRFATTSPVNGGGRKRVSREERWSYENFKRVTFRSAWPLAERYEALIRAFNNPIPYARRLAARLHATPHRLQEALRAPPEAVHRVEDFNVMGERAQRSWRPHFSSA